MTDEELKSIVALVKFLKAEKIEVIKDESLINFLKDLHSDFDAV